MVILFNERFLDSYLENKIFIVKSDGKPIPSLSESDGMGLPSLSVSDGMGLPSLSMKSLMKKYVPPPIQALDGRTLPQDVTRATPS